MHVWRFTWLPTLLLLMTGCSFSNQTLPTDDELLDRWQSTNAQLLERIEACNVSESSASLQAAYQGKNRLLALTSIKDFKQCEVASDSERDDSLPQLAQKDGTYLLISDRYRKGTGWIEESASQWSGGWISWKTTILEEKGFVYAPTGALETANAPLPITTLTTEPLDQFSGRYRTTSQLSGTAAVKCGRCGPLNRTGTCFIIKAVSARRMTALHNKH